MSRVRRAAGGCRGGRRGRHELQPGWSKSDGARGRPRRCGASAAGPGANGAWQPGAARPAKPRRLGPRARQYGASAAKGSTARSAPPAVASDAARRTIAPSPTAARRGRPAAPPTALGSTRPPRRRRCRAVAPPEPVERAGPSPRQMAVGRGQALQRSAPSLRPAITSSVCPTTRSAVRAPSVSNAGAAHRRAGPVAPRRHRQRDAPSPRRLTADNAARHAHPQDRHGGSSTTSGQMLSRRGPHSGGHQQPAGTATSSASDVGRQAE